METKKYVLTQLIDVEIDIIIYLLMNIDASPLKYQM